MASGGKRKGAGAPRGNSNALKHGGRARVLYGIPLDKKLTRFEYRALCMEQMDRLKYLDEITGGTVYTFETYNNHRRRYIGAIEFNERRNKRRASRYDQYLLRELDNALVSLRYI